MTTDKLTVTNSLSELDKIFKMLTDFLVKNDIDDEEQTNMLCMCIDEIFSNIVNYAYDDDKEHAIDITFDGNKQEKKLVITMVDDGKEFNPLDEAPEPEMAVDIMERQIGGLGLFIVTNIMTEVQYERIQKKNLLRMIKNID